jgi:hypothetical protein
MKKIIETILFLTIFVILPNVTSSQSPKDSDSDGLGDQVEQSVYRTDPRNFDTDADGYPDGAEVAAGYSPHVAKKQLRQVDSDRDGLWDDWEIALGTDLLGADTDGDGYPDGREVRQGYDPLSPEPRAIAKRIEINLAEQRLRYYAGGIKLDEFPISSGLKATPTPVGQFSVLAKRQTVYYAGPGYSYPNTRWNLMFKRGQGLNYYVHGAYWHDDFGKPKSHGCVNVPHTYEYMGRLYDLADVGTPVAIRS